MSKMPSGQAAAARVALHPRVSHAGHWFVKLWEGHHGCRQDQAGK